MFWFILPNHVFRLTVHTCVKIGKSPTIPFLYVGNISLATSSSKTLENYFLFTKPCPLPVNSWHVESSPHVTTHASTVLTCTYVSIHTYVHIHTNICQFFLPFHTGQNSILSHFIRFSKLKKKDQKHHINMILRVCTEYQHKTPPFKGT
jgi:hypothetical protein